MFFNLINIKHPLRLVETGENKKKKRCLSSRRMTAEVNDPICFVVEKKDTKRRKDDRNDLMKR